jgi:hypothetical protein
MKKWGWCLPGAAVLVLGVFIVLTPAKLFPVCEADHLGWVTDFKPTMRCFWLGQTEMLLGSGIAAAGLALILRPRRDSAFIVGVVLLVLGAAVILASLNGVIGSVCGHANSRCQIGTKPALRLAGGLVMLVGLGLFCGTVKKPKSS